jgi:2-methylcitrate dehydratase PrpD
LDVEKTAAAMGLAMSGVSVSFHNFGTDAHYLESTFQSLQGMIAADMAKTGMSGNPDIATFLLNHLGGERVDPKKMVEGLGEKWVMSEIWIKKYPCCFLTHRQIDSVIELRKKHNLSLEEVASIEVHASPGDEVCNRPEPRSEGDLQFSFQHILAAAMLDGDVNTQNISDKAVNDQKYVRARQTVNFILHPDLSKEILVDPSRVVIKTKDGREWSHERRFPIGHPKEPLTQQQFRDLYSKFTRDLLPAKEISKTARAIFELEKLANPIHELGVLYAWSGGKR